jgi:hypothetical protein
MITTPTRKSLPALAAAVAFCGFSAAHAQDSFTVSGPINYAYHYDYQTGSYNYIYDGSFAATVTHEPSVPEQYYEYENPGYYKYGYSIWYGAVTSIEYDVFDASGAAIIQSEVISGQQDYGQNYAYSYAVDYQDGYYYSQDYREELFYTYGYSYTPVYEYHYGYVQSSGNTDLDVTVGPQQYPDLSDNLDWATYNNAYFHNETSSTYSYVSGIFDAVTGGDFDGDGIADGDDACIESDLTATVIVGTTDTGVANTLLASGCTITDMITQIQLDELNHGQVVSGVAHFLNAIKDDGTISGKDKGKLQSATAKSKEKGKKN